jgi:hypothetical protein
MPNGKPKAVDGVCPCCRKVDSHEQTTDDEETEDEKTQEEYPNVQPYIQMLHDVKRSIECSEPTPQDTVKMLHIRRIPCAGNGCPARFHSLCSVRNIRLPNGEVTLECPCDNICFTLNCGNCNSKGIHKKKADPIPKPNIPTSKGKSPANSPKPRVFVEDTSTGFTTSSPRSIQQSDHGNVSDNSSCNSPILARQKPASIIRATVDIVNISSDDDNEDIAILIDTSDDEIVDL